MNQISTNMKSRPVAINQIHRGNWTRSVAHIQHLYALTYDGELVSILDSTQLPQAPKYKKHTWSQLGTAQSQCARYNLEFNTDRFAVAELTIKNIV